MRIVCDQYIPYLVEAVREAWPEVQITALEPELITPAAIQDADILVVRTRTRVDEALLAGSAVRMVCTATIGFNHIDTRYCENHGIQWMACPGCNAQAVCDYIEQAVDELFPSVSSSLTIGVVGVGHIGSLVAKMAESKGLQVLLNDPPKKIGVPLSELARRSDIITFHVPLTDSSALFPTLHLCDEAFLAQCKPSALIINASRGGVVDEAALLRSGRPYVLDTWENEPDIHPEVLSHATRASMHIAGYSKQGKRNASQMCLDAIAHAFSLPPIILPEIPVQARTTGSNWLMDITRALQAQPDQFEILRKNYPLR